MYYVDATANDFRVEVVPLLSRGLIDSFEAPTMKC